MHEEKSFKKKRRIWRKLVKNFKIERKKRKKSTFRPGDLLHFQIAHDTDRLYDVLFHRFKHRDKRKPWVFWHRYFSKKTHEWVEGPFIDRKSIMKSLCKKAGVKYFRYHALRHCGASLLDNANVPIGSIQRFLGHENRMTTEIYLHSMGNSERDAIAMLDLDFKKVSHQSTHQAKKVFN